MVERMLHEPDKYASCPYDEKILDFYKGQFDSVYILLHPFLQPKKIALERFCPEFWPSKHEIIDGCEAVSWARVLELTNLKSLTEIDIGLRTSIRGLVRELENKEFENALIVLEREKGIILPSEGRLPPLLENLLFEAIKTLGYQWLWIGDEFGTERKLYWIDGLIEKDEVPGRAAIFTHDHSLLITTHWDSHCSFLCSSKDNIEKILSYKDFEGFYCSEKTEIYWSLHEI